MTGDSIKLTGWQAVIAIVVLIGIVLFRITTMSDKTNDENLMSKIEFQLQTDFLPSDAAKMKSSFESGNIEELSKLAKSTTTSKINIESVKASYPLFNFSTEKKYVIVKVNYSIKDTYGVRDSGTKYYKFEYRPLVNTWRYRHDSSVISYFLNFL